MNQRYAALAEAISTHFGGKLEPVESTCGELTYEVGKNDLLDVARALRDEDLFRFDMLIDLCGVDYLAFGSAEWETQQATGTGFSRARVAIPANIVPDADAKFDSRRFAVVYHLLSVALNHRVRLRVYTGPDNPPTVPSVVAVWNSANWYEREAFDLFGTVFEGHPDLRRLLTDYGFIGHPFRKDFPVIGNVEVRYDPDASRVVYQPVSIENRTLVPKVIRDDNRYDSGLRDTDVGDSESGDTELGGGDENA
jgi:NADH-quinone oxidoreductase subunit C